MDKMNINVGRRPQRRGPMKDKFDIELEPGQLIVYATTQGSSAVLNHALVLRVDVARISIQNLEKYWHTYTPHPVWLRASERIVIVGEDNAEDRP